jgi:Raf kinase inhibitor-like YbhB/YbcL family protein
MTFKMNIEAFREGAAIPQRHTGDGENLSPALAWEEAPFPCKSFALIVDDPDAPSGTWTHWLLWDVPASLRKLEEGFQAGTLGVSGTNDFGRTGYGGPAPPPGHGPHRYNFRLMALDVEVLGLVAGARRKELDRALQGHILAEARYMGRYERPAR